MNLCPKKLYYATKCPFCQSLNTVKNGSGDHGQRYKCGDCKRRFRLKDFKKEKEYEHLWNEFVFSKQTLRELTELF